MKILHIIDSGGLYGAEMVLLYLVAEQIKMGLDPTIASIGEKHIEEKPLETEAVKRCFKVKKFRMRPGPNYLGALKILKFAHHEGFDLMHSHGFKGNIFYGFMPKNIRKLPLLTTLHGWTSTNSLTKMRLYVWLDSKSFRYIDAVVCVSEAMKSHPKLKVIKGNNLHIVHNGIPALDFHTPSQHRDIATSTPSSYLPSFSASDPPSVDQSIIDFCKKGCTIGSIGRLSFEKGFNNLIDAIKIAQNNCEDLRLVVMGEGQERRNLERRIYKLSLEEKILLPGYRRNAKMYLPYFKLFILPSLSEGFPITILEAMQMGTPIISTKAGDVPKILNNGEAGLLVANSKPLDLAHAIQRLHRDPDLGNELAIQAKKIFKENYSSQIMASKYLDIYRFLK